jgi:predicted nuclease of restriction endonuclease-like (RecB) superfamily
LDELVFAIPTEKLWDIIPYNQKGFVNGNSNLLNRIAKCGIFDSRVKLEEDSSFKQTIPYGIITSSDYYFLFRRGVKQTEKRLHNRLTLGVGGHMNQTNSLSRNEEYFIDELKREFYIAMSASEHWSVRILDERINSMLYERTQISKLPEETIKNDLSALSNENKMSAELFFRDPYILDFLGLKDTYSEKDLENAILMEIEKFILEMGRDFAFIGRQVRITVGNKDYYIDLLFYHRKLKRLVLIELKLGEFLPDHKGQVEFYLRYLEQNEKNEGEEPPIGIILCAEKDQETVELLELDKSGIHVGRYLTQLPPKHLLENNLRKAIANAKRVLEHDKNS